MATGRQRAASTSAYRTHWVIARSLLMTPLQERKRSSHFTDEETEGRKSEEICKRLNARKRECSYMYLVKTASHRTALLGESVFSGMKDVSVNVGQRAAGSSPKPIVFLLGIQLALPQPPSQGGVVKGPRRPVTHG